MNDKSTPLRASLKLAIDKFREICTTDPTPSPSKLQSISKVSFKQVKWVELRCLLDLL